MALLDRSNFKIAELMGTKFITQHGEFYVVIPEKYNLKSESSKVNLIQRIKNNGN